MSIIQRIQNFSKTRRGGVTFFSTALVGTGLLLCASNTAIFSTGGIAPIAHAFTTGATSPHGIRVSGTLSQSKLVQGYGGEVYLKIAVEAPEKDGAEASMPTEVIVVLDRSGSMSAAQKMPYAKQAIYRLIDDLGPEDRFSLVSFDSRARVDFGLAPMTNQNRAQVRRIVSMIRPGSATNMSDGLEQAERLLRRDNEYTRRRVILLSDGEANRGKTSPVQLSQIARSIAGTGGVVSTIGMGLSFNEVVMAGIADNGMGHYSFLEDVRGLDMILAKDLKDSRGMFAKASSVEIELPKGIRLVDAAGYPTRGLGNNRVAIDSGQLISGVKRNITLTLRVPTHHESEFEIGPVHFSYSRDGESVTMPLKETYALAVVPQDRKYEAVASIKEDVFKETWVQNNLGRMRKDLNTYIREGKKEKAKEAVATYNSALLEAEEASGIALASDELKNELDKVQKDLDDAFVGTPSAQQMKQSRFGKTMHLKSRAEQRSSITK